jgi:hypothetical protein
MMIKGLIDSQRRDWRYLWRVIGVVLVLATAWDIVPFLMYGPRYMISPQFRSYGTPVYVFSATVMAEMFLLYGNGLGALAQRQWPYVFRGMLFSITASFPLAPALSIVLLTSDIRRGNAMVFACVAFAAWISIVLWARFVVWRYWYRSRNPLQHE